MRNSLNILPVKYSSTVNMVAMTNICAVQVERDTNLYLQCQIPMALKRFIICINCAM